MELDCGIPRVRIVAWLDDELSLARASDDGEARVFPLDGRACHITLAPLENRVLGKLDLERTLVRVEGDDTAVDAFLRLFTLRFISAGG